MKATGWFCLCWLWTMVKCEQSSVAPYLSEVKVKQFARFEV